MQLHCYDFFSALIFEKHFLCLIFLTGAEGKCHLACKGKTDGEHTGQEGKEKASFAKLRVGVGWHPTCQSKAEKHLLRLLLVTLQNVLGSVLSFCRMCWVQSCRSAECAGFSLVVLQNVLGSVLSFCRMCWVQSCRSAECAGFSLVVLQNVLGSILFCRMCWVQSCHSAECAGFKWVIMLGNSGQHFFNTTEFGLTNTPLHIDLNPPVSSVEWVGGGGGVHTDLGSVTHCHGFTACSMPQCRGVSGCFVHPPPPPHTHTHTHTPACPSWGLVELNQQNNATNKKDQ